MIQINISNKLAYTLIALLVILSTILVVYAYTNPIPNPGHGGDTILVSSPTGEEMTLQTLINSGKLADCRYQINSGTGLINIGCPSGYIVTGGGFSGATASNPILSSRPYLIGNTFGWACNSDGAKTCYAVCCKLYSTTASSF